jgi:hypothetical protein
MAWILTSNNFDVILAHGDLSPEIDHDATSNFVAAEHVDHSAVSVLAGSGLTGGGTIEADRTLNVVGGKGIGVAADSCYIDVTDTNWLHDEDNMASNSASHCATQQSIKAYVDATIPLNLPADPGFDATVLWDDSASTYVSVAPGTGLSISATPKLNIDVTDTNFFLDEDTMVSNSATKVASQQSIKAYVDSNSPGLTLVELKDASSDTSLVFSTGLSSYTSILIVLENLVPGTDDRDVWIQIGVTSTVLTSAYYYGGYGVNSAGASWTMGSTVGTGWILNDGRWGVGSAAGETGMSGQVWLHGFGEAKDTHMTWHTGFFAYDTHHYGHSGIGRQNTNSVMGAIKVLYSAGSLVESGRVIVYGLN